MTDEAGAVPNLPGLDLAELRVRTRLNEVWRGVRRDTGAAVAVKLARTPAGPEMLRQEARTVDALRAAAITRVVPAEFRADPVPHLVLPWKGGRTLRDALQEIDGADGRARLVQTFLQVVGIVAEAHRRGFLHGDLKPENVLLDDEGRPWLTDFGMARVIRAERLESRVSLSMSASEDAWGGTLHYLPPEGLQGEAPTASWDVYALGVMLHEILLGHRPDRAATPEQLKSRLPAEIVQVLLDALAYAPKDRIPSVLVLQERLKAIGTELTATGGRRRALRAYRLGVVGLAAFFVALRYVSVFALTATYVAILVGAFIHPAVLAAYLPFALLHSMVRWEGPETHEEVEARRKGTLIGMR